MRPIRMQPRLVVSLGLAAATALSAQDRSFVLTSTDPAHHFPAYLGNGRFSLVTSSHGAGKSLSILAGLFEHVPGDVPRIAALPSWSEVDVFDGTKRLNAAEPSGSVLRSYSQVVNMYEGSVRTSYDWIDGARRTSVRVDAFVSRADPRLAAIRFEIVPHQNGRVTVSLPIRARERPRRLRLAELERTEPSWGIADVWYPGYMAITAHGASADLTSGLAWVSTRTEGAPPVVAVAEAVAWPRTLHRAAVRTPVSDTAVSVDVTFDAVAGDAVVFHKFVSVTSSDEHRNPIESARRHATAARARGYDALFDDHARAWRALWATDIVVDGDPELQRAIRAMIFHLLGSIRDGSSVSIAPMGLSGAGYYGHYFWDGDTWMFPPLLLMHPRAARSMVMFRHRTLAAAQRNARANGYQGAMYPWEADALGRETTPRFAYQNALYEIHVTGDVALAQWQYYLASGDRGWLSRYGYPVIAATADFWVSRVSYDSVRSRYEIRHVVSVDEGLIGIHNDAYTNAVARTTLLVASAAGRTLRRKPNPRWTEVAAALYVPYDSVAEYHPTYENAPVETRGSVVPLLSFPMQLPMSDRAKRNDLDHAVRRLAQTGSGAMMTITFYPVVAAELGERRLFDELVPNSYRPYLRGPYLALAETPTNDAVNFITGAGGFLQQVIFGYTGLRLTEEGLVPKYRPMLPTGVTRLTLRNFHVRGARRDVIVEGDTLRIVEPQ